MSDPTNPPPSDPYGAQPPGEPYRQPEQPPAAANPYGQAPPTYGAPSYGTGDPDKRPGTVTAASIITIVFSVLVFLLLAVAVVAMVAARDDLLDEIWTQLQEQDAAGDLTRDDLDDAWGVLIAIPVIGMIWTLIATITASLAMKRQNWARIVTVVSAVVTALISVVSIGSVVSGLTLIAAIAAIVLYFTGGANEWYSRKNSYASQLPPGTQQPWG